MACESSGSATRPPRNHTPLRKKPRREDREGECVRPQPQLQKPTPDPDPEPESSAREGTFNYFNYFTEIEEYFWQKRGAHLLVSPLDWAIVETWQKAGIPLSAVLKGIDRAFESYARSKRAAGGRQLKSLTYCVDAVLEAADEEKETAAGTGPVVSSTKKEE